METLILWMNFSYLRKGRVLLRWTEHNRGNSRTENCQELSFFNRADDVEQSL
jgi:hypothetical protein